MMVSSGMLVRIETAKAQEVERIYLTRHMFEVPLKQARTVSRRNPYGQIRGNMQHPFEIEVVVIPACWEAVDQRLHTHCLKSSVLPVRVGHSLI